MPNLTIKSHNGSRDWTGNYGPMVDHNLTISVDGKDFDVYMTKKPDSPAPQAGESFEFEKVKQDDHGIKIKRVYDKPFDASNNGGGGGGGGRTSDRMIAAQVAAKCAAEVAAHKGGDIDKLTGEFMDAILKYGQEPQAPAPTGSDPLPADTSGLDDTGPQDADPNDEIPF
jgi:hypothetical protein